MRSGSRGRTGDIDMNNEKEKLMEHLIHFDAVIEHVK